MAAKRKAPATPPTPPAATALALSVPVSVDALAAQQREAEAELQVYRVLAVDDAEQYAFADALLGEVSRKIDAATAVRKAATGPIYAGIRQVEAWFRPLLDALGASQQTLKQIMGSYRITQEALARAERERATAAITAGDSVATVAALTAAVQAEARPVGARSPVVMRWAPVIVDADAVPRAYVLIDVAALEKLGRENRNGPAPVVSGIDWERVADVSAKR